MPIHWHRSANGLVRSPIAGVRRVHEGLGSSLGGGAPPVRRGDLLRLRVECRGLLGEEVIAVVVAVPSQSGLTERGMAIALTTPAPRLGDLGLQLLQLGARYYDLAGASP